MTRNRFFTLLLAIPLWLQLSAPQGFASGAYVHIFVAERALGGPFIADPYIRDLLIKRKDLYKFAAVFPDSFGVPSISGILKEGADGDSEIAHGTILNAYSRAIYNECFAERPFGRKTCKHRPDIACSTNDDCKVNTPKRCTGPGHPLCDATGCPGLLNTCNDNNICDEGERCCHGLLNDCNTTGVCTGDAFDDYRTGCVMFTTDDCPGILNGCVDDYGSCVDFTQLDDKCEKLVAHFMGTLAHIVTDTNFDKFFVRTVAERSDCSEVEVPDPPWPCGTDHFPRGPQDFTDQEMDGHLGFTGGSPGSGILPLWMYIPTEYFAGRVAVQDLFLEEVCRNAGIVDDDISLRLEFSWDFQLKRKVDDQGDLFDGGYCSKRPDMRCDSSADDTCKVKATARDDGVCTEDYKKCCRDGIIPSDCEGFFNTCSDDYGNCKLVGRRDPFWEDCRWAIDDDRWYTESGGANDSGREVGAMINKAWSLMSNGGVIFVKRNGGGLHFDFCLANIGVDCLHQRALEVGVEATEGSLPGDLSGWSNGGKPGGKALEVNAETGTMQFNWRHGFAGGPACTGPFEVRFDPAFPDEHATITDTLMAAFIERLPVQLRCERLCSDNGTYLVKAVRLAGTGTNAPPTANAGPDQIVECSSAAGAVATLDGTGSDDPDGDVLTYQWSAPGIVFDDPTSPTPTGSFPIDTTTVTLEVSDGEETVLDTVDVTVQDTVAPTLTVSLDPEELWPPNHRMVEITAHVEATDSCSVPSVVLAAVFSSEPGDDDDDDDGDDDGHAFDSDDEDDDDNCHNGADGDDDDGDDDDGDDGEGADIQGAMIGTEDYQFCLRAERKGHGPGRTYTVIYEATDAYGNRARTEATVIVPHDQRGGG